MGFVKDFDKLPTGVQRRIDAAKNIPTKTTVLPPDFPTIAPQEPMAPKHVEGVEEKTEDDETALTSGTKVSISIRVDVEIVRFFKATGKGWQTRMNTDLLEFVRGQQKG